MRTTMLLCTLALAAQSGIATAGPSAGGLPANNIDCKDFTKRPDGTWYAHPDAKPITVGTVKNVGTRDVLMFPHTMQIGDYDLTDLLDRKCGHSGR